MMLCVCLCLLFMCQLLLSAGPPPPLLKCADDNYDQEHRIQNCTNGETHCIGPRYPGEQDKTGAVRRRCGSDSECPQSGCRKDGGCCCEANYCNEEFGCINTCPILCQSNIIGGKTVRDVMLKPCFHKPPTFGMCFRTETPTGLLRMGCSTTDTAPDCDASWPKCLQKQQKDGHTLTCCCLGDDCNENDCTDKVCPCRQTQPKPKT